MLFFSHAFKPMFFAQIDMLAWFIIVCVCNRQSARNTISDHELYNVVKIHEKEKK